MAKIIYDRQGNVSDVSDEGAGMRGIEDSVDFQIMIKNLSEKGQKIATMLSEEYTWFEIKKECKCSQKTIKNTIDKLASMIKDS